MVSAVRAACGWHGLARHRRYRSACRVPACFHPGRAGASGQAVSLVSLDEKKELAGIERLISQRLNSEAVEGFEPTPGGGPKVDDNEGRQPRGGQRRGNGGGRGNNAGGRGNGGGRGSSSGQRSGASGNRGEGNRGDSGNRNGDAPARRRRRSQGGQRRSGGGTPNGNV